MTRIEKETPVRSHASINSDHRRHGLPALLALACCLGLLALGAAPAMADFGLTTFDSTLANQDATPTTQAGSHPYEATTTVMFSTDVNGRPTENVKDIVTALPPGLIGNASALPKCTVQELDNTGVFGTTAGSPLCPAGSQVGQIGLIANIGSTTELVFPLYNMVPPAGMPAQFGANALVVNTFVDISVRTGGDYGLTASVNDASAGLPLVGSILTLWGVPADPSHDALRGAFCSGAPPDPCSGGFVSGGGLSAGTGLVPFLTMPTACDGPLTTSVRVDSWQHPGQFVDASSSAPAVDGCDHLTFDPSVSVQPQTTAADSPTGLDVDVHVPQLADGSTALAPSTLKKAVIALPAGLSLNPASADGLAGCAPAQIGIDDAAEPSCPDASKVGTVEIDSPIQADPLVGSIYLAQPGSNPFGTPLAIYVVAESDGVLLKLAGRIDADPTTGQLTTTFDDNPQLPFTDFRLHFFSGPRAAFATPESCGTFPVTSALSPWSGAAAVTPGDAFAISAGCVSGFSPSFIAGVSNPQAGASSPFALSFSRSDTDQELSGISVSLPPGLIAHPAGVPLCSDADANAGTCPSGSQVGTAEIGAGAGTAPFFLSGKVFLTGPYKGGPYGLAVVSHAVAGPLDLGTVVVRQALKIDPNDAHVTAVSDALPTILGGIPLRLRRVDLTLDRPGFMRNPTSCDPSAVTGTISSTGGLSAPVSSRFQVGGCAGLAFSPALTLKISGRRQSTRGKHPALTATLTQPAGQANVSSAKVTLPSSLSINPANLSGICSAADAAALKCPANTIVGSASLLTPLLPHALSGPVYLAQAGKLPGLLVVLTGADGVSLTLHAATTFPRGGGLVTTFTGIPDAPVSSFTLTLNGGSHGILTVGRGANLCRGTLSAAAGLVGQNGKVSSSSRSISRSAVCSRGRAARGAGRTRGHSTRRR